MSNDEEFLQLENFLRSKFPNLVFDQQHKENIWNLCKNNKVELKSLKDVLESFPDYSSQQSDGCQTQQTLLFEKIRLHLEKCVPSKHRKQDWAGKQRVPFPCVSNGQEFKEKKLVPDESGASGDPLSTDEEMSQTFEEKIAFWERMKSKEEPNGAKNYGQHGGSHKPKPIIEIGGHENTMHTNSMHQEQAPVISKLHVPRPSIYAHILNSFLPRLRRALRSSQVGIPGIPDTHCQNEEPEIAHPLPNTGKPVMNLGNAQCGTRSHGGSQDDKKNEKRNDDRSDAAQQSGDLDCQHGDTGTAEVGSDNGVDCKENGKDTTSSVGEEVCPTGHYQDVKSGGKIPDTDESVLDLKNAGCDTDSHGAKTANQNGQKQEDISEKSGEDAANKPRNLSDIEQNEGTGSEAGFGKGDEEHVEECLTMDQDRKEERGREEEPSWGTGSGNGAGDEENGTEVNRLVGEEGGGEEDDKPMEQVMEEKNNQVFAEEVHCQDVKPESPIPVGDLENSRCVIHMYGDNQDGTEQEKKTEKSQEDAPRDVLEAEKNGGAGQSGNTECDVENGKDDEKFEVKKDGDKHGNQEKREDKNQMIVGEVRPSDNLEQNNTEQDASRDQVPNEAVMVRPDMTGVEEKVVEDESKWGDGGVERNLMDGNEPQTCVEYEQRATEQIRDIDHGDGQNQCTGKNTAVSHSPQTDKNQMLISISEDPPVNLSIEPIQNGRRDPLTVYPTLERKEEVEMSEELGEILIDENGTRFTEKRNIIEGEATCDLGNGETSTKMEFGGQEIAHPSLPESTKNQMPLAPSCELDLTTNPGEYGEEMDVTGNQIIDREETESGRDDPQDANDPPDRDVVDHQPRNEPEQRQKQTETTAIAIAQQANKCPVIPLPVTLNDKILDDMASEKNPSCENGRNTEDSPPVVHVVMDVEEKKGDEEEGGKVEDGENGNLKGDDRIQPGGESNLMSQAATLTSKDKLPKGIPADVQPSAYYPISDKMDQTGERSHGKDTSNAKLDPRSYNVSQTGVNPTRGRNLDRKRPNSEACPGKKIPSIIEPRKSKRCPQLKQKFKVRRSPSHRLSASDSALDLGKGQMLRLTAENEQTGPECHSAKNRFVASTSALDLGEGRVLGLTAENKSVEDNLLPQKPPGHPKTVPVIVPIEDIAQRGDEIVETTEEKVHRTMRNKRKRPGLLADTKKNTGNASPSGAIRKRNGSVRSMPPSKMKGESIRRTKNSFDLEENGEYRAKERFKMKQGTGSRTAFRTGRPQGAKTDNLKVDITASKTKKVGRQQLKLPPDKQRSNSDVLSELNSTLPSRGVSRETAGCPSCGGSVLHSGPGLEPFAAGIPRNKNSLDLMEKVENRDKGREPQRNTKTDQINMEGIGARERAIQPVYPGYRGRNTGDWSLLKSVRKKYANGESVSHSPLNVDTFEAGELDKINTLDLEKDGENCTKEGETMEHETGNPSLPRFMRKRNAGGGSVSHSSRGDAANYTITEHIPIPVLEMNAPTTLPDNERDTHSKVKRHGPAIHQATDSTLGKPPGLGQDPTNDFQLGLNEQGAWKRRLGRSSFTMDYRHGRPPDNTPGSIPGVEMPAMDQDWIDDDKVSENAEEVGAVGGENRMNCEAAQESQTNVGLEPFASGISGVNDGQQRSGAFHDVPHPSSQPQSSLIRGCVRIGVQEIQVHSEEQREAKFCTVCRSLVSMGRIDQHSRRFICEDCTLRKYLQEDYVRRAFTTISDRFRKKTKKVCYICKQPLITSSSLDCEKCGQYICRLPECRECHRPLCRRKAFSCWE